ncbi:MAG: hypothetical protein LBK95_07195 [Bifidobacteriaceae bacterium]|nr:hypothetical protein [Bifidobacteriaceae bacterium]
MTARDGSWDVGSQQCVYVAALDTHEFGMLVVELGKISAPARLTRRR